MSPLIITCPIIGAELTNSNYPYLPKNKFELAKSAIDAVKSGATIIHLHVRDEFNNPSQDPAIFKEVMDLILNEVECIIQFSTGGAVGTSLKERMAPLSLKPPMATLSMGSMNFGADLFLNTKDIIDGLLNEMNQLNIMPELEIFDLGMMDTAIRYIEKNHFKNNIHFDFVFGVPGGMDASLDNLNFLIKKLPTKNQTYTVSGIGRFQLPMTTHSILLGGHIRIGIEDNIYLRKGQLAQSNKELIQRSVAIAQSLDRQVATLKETKEILKLLN
jgi:3-keto-5-aminohexanoate cleavage enzyme